MPKLIPFTHVKRLLRLIRAPVQGNEEPFVRPNINPAHAQNPSKGINSLQEVLEFNAVHNPNRVFCTQLRKQARGENGISTNTEEHISFIHLLKAVELASAWLLQNGCTTGRSRQDEKVPPVGILLSSDITIFIYLAALRRIGVPVLLLSARLTAEALQHLLKETSPSCILVNSQMLRTTASDAIDALSSHDEVFQAPTVVQALGYEAFLNPHHRDLVGSPIPPKFIEVINDESTAFILHSSGTTGLPKPVYHSPGWFLALATAHRLPDHQLSHKRSLSSLPLYHTFGLLPTGLSLSIGMAFTLLPGTTIPNGRSLHDTLRCPRISYLFTVPSLLEDMLSLSDEMGLLALRRLAIVAVGGAPMKDSVGDTAIAAGINLLNHWGCTELGPMTPIEIPNPHVNWRCLRPRTDTNLSIKPVNNNRFQISGCLPGRAERFIVQDTLEKDPEDERQYRLGGRQDNLIVLSTGEKISPSLLETEVGKHPQVKDALAFGDHQTSLGLLIELRKGTDRTAFLNAIQPYLDRGNAFMDNHGKVDLDMVFLTSEDTKPLIRTDKGTLSRNASVSAFMDEIASCYTRSNSSSPAPRDYPSLRLGDENALRESIREIVKSVLGFDGIEDEADFFEVGMDSLQVSRLRRVLEVSLNSPASSEDSCSFSEIKIGSDFCFRHSSISKMHHAVAELLSGESNTTLESAAKDSRAEAMRDLFNRYRELILTDSSVSLDERIRTHHSAPLATVLITGSTGSLGSFLLHRLATDANVAKVICLCRRHGHPAEEPWDRQRRLMKERGLMLDDSLWSKIVIQGADFSREDFGLQRQALEELTSITHIVHNAWPVNFNWSLSSFQQQFETFSHLIRLARFCGARKSPHLLRPRFVFISSIAVAGQYPAEEVPEIELSPRHTAEMGYAESKWVAEKLLLSTSRAGDNTSTPLFESSIIRIGQISGAEQSGAWNESENIPIIVKTARKLGCLPSIQGSLSWIPVNRTADAICELMFSKRFCQFYHIENPSRQRWADVLQDLARVINPSNPAPVIPFAEWLNRVRERGEHDNPAFSLLGFLERDFSRIAGGALTLSTQNAREDSMVLSATRGIQPSLLKAYVEYWTTTRDRQ